MKAEIQLHANGPHRVIVTAENEAEKALMKIFDAQYIISANLVRGNYPYGGDRDIEGVEFHLVPANRDS